MVETKSVEEEPRDKFQDSGLANAQFQIESKIVGLYQRSIGPETLKIFG